MKNIGKKLQSKAIFDSDGYQANLNSLNGELARTWQTERKTAGTWRSPSWSRSKGERQPANSPASLASYD
jgi:hypothetical protein